MKASLIILSAGIAAAVYAGDINCEEYRKDVTAVMPEFSAFGKANKRNVQLLDKNGKTLGSLQLSPKEKYTRTEGFNGFINTAVILDNNGKISGIAIGKHRETPRFIDKIRRSGFMKRWNGKHIKEADKHKVDAVSGATYSCEAIKSELKVIFENNQRLKTGK